MNNNHIREYPWIGRIALTTVGATFILLIMGGIVSSKGVGMAVPDWPTTFGYNMFTYPFSKMVGGIFYEHSHRLLGSLVGFLTIGLTTAILWKDDRKWLKVISVVALFAVIVQGIMGGLRVVEISKSFAVAHGAFAHAFFALVVSIAFFLSNFWKDIPTDNNVIEASQLRRFSIITTVAIYLQLIAGAVYRHTGNWFWIHMLLALIVTTIIFLLMDSVNKKVGKITFLRRIAITLGALIVLQLFSGLGAYMTKLISPDPLTASAIVVTITLIHVLSGALIFSFSVLLTLGIFKSTKESTELATA